MKTKTKIIDISSVAPIFLFASFAICIMSVLLMGASLYRKQTERDLTGYQKRTVHQYITTRIHQSDRYDSFFVGDFSSKTPQNTGNAFFLSETINEKEYYTCIYCHNGYLYELFSSGEDSLDMTAGEPVLQVDSVNFIDNGQYITAVIMHTDGSVQKSVVDLRCSGEKLS